LGWRECLDLIGLLARNPGSQLFADIQGWQYPFSLQEHALADLIDLTAQIHTKKGKKIEPWPHRPQRTTPNKQRVSDRGRLTPQQIVTALQAAKQGRIENPM